MHSKLKQIGAIEWLGGYVFHGGTNIWRYISRPNAVLFCGTGRDNIKVDTDAINLSIDIFAMRDAIEDAVGATLDVVFGDVYVRCYIADKTGVIITALDPSLFTNHMMCMYMEVHDIIPKHCLDIAYCYIICILRNFELTVTIRNKDCEKMLLEVVSV